jgi:hypothetical protein
MNVAKPKPKAPQQPANDSTPQESTGVRDTHAPRDSERVTAPPSEDFERHDTIPAPTWFEEASDPIN